MADRNLQGTIVTARILVVDDNEINLRLLEARLGAEFYEVTTAVNGPEALALAATGAVDLVLLDVMMPGMDGYEVCRRLKADPQTMHIPVVLVTALDQASDRIEGLNAGADDFLTKPARDLQLFTRLRSLTRLKRVTDELRERAATALALFADEEDVFRAASGRDRILMYGDDPRECSRLLGMLHDRFAIDAAAEREDFMTQLRAAPEPEAALLDLGASETDVLRLLASLRTSEAGRHLPVVVMGRPEQETAIAKAMEIGASDYIQKPIDRNELRARLATQVRRRRYESRLRRSLSDTVALAVRDPLTGLHNRRFFDARLAKAVAQARSGRKRLSIVVVDIDHFKRINDGCGHAAGDEVLRQFAGRLQDSLRGSDLACRIGGEEFVVLMPDTDGEDAMRVAERIREEVAAAPFAIPGASVAVTVSAGLAELTTGDDGSSLVARADRSLYEAKRAGRNRVLAAAA
jgi:two-component system, cell cycle response regulator